jgi:acylphosphatase
MSGSRDQQVPRSVRRHFEIGGRVQMVGFRAFAAHHGQRLGLKGWVCNTDAGGVQVTAEGQAELVEEFLSLLRHGPAAARVTSFSVTEEEPGPVLADFSSLG